MKMLIKACSQFCFINSWVAVITLSIFAWVAQTEPILLEIDEKKNYKAGRNTLIVGALSNLVLAIFFTFLVVFKDMFERRRQKAMREKMDDEINSLLLDPSMRDSGTMYSFAEIDDSDGIDDLDDDSSSGFGGGQSR